MIIVTVKHATIRYVFLSDSAAKDTPFEYDLQVEWTLINDLRRVHLVSRENYSLTETLPLSFDAASYRFLYHL